MISRILAEGRRGGPRFRNCHLGIRASRLWEFDVGQGPPTLRVCWMVLAEAPVTEMGFQP